MKIINQFTGESYRPDSWEMTPDNFLRVHARVLKEGVFPYDRSEFQDIPGGITDQQIMIYIPMDSISSGECMRSLEGSQATAYQHNWITPENATESKGHAAGSALINGPYQEIDYLVTDPETIGAVKRREIGEISAAYHAEVQWLPGEWNGQKYHGIQRNIEHNHSAILRPERGRLGEDVKILNSKGTNIMADVTMVKVRLPRTGRFVFMNEDGSKDFEEENRRAEEDRVRNEEEGAKKDRSIEEKMKGHEDLKKENEDLKRELEESKGELSVIKKKLDELLSDESVEKKAGEMNEEQKDADDIVENAEVKDEDGKEVPEEKKEEFKNSYRKLHGEKLHTRILNSVGIDTKGMSSDAKRGAFRAAKAMSPRVNRATVSGHNMFQNQSGGSHTGRDASLKTLGF